ncbi:uncharacterized protein LOC117327181 isoform X1 [Pecten maximus]|uniref:uncharacterized protein LOC117327181 isoform X1 n=1 Tax=Pecten maximus TaxID=6579 RepID=UPI0014581682|nr:uncharacterized protein LOC117327181 isoform X1 [Pecten maximus]
MRYLEMNFDVNYFLMQLHLYVRYADEMGLPQPAAPRGRDSFPPIYLPGSETYLSVHKKYSQVCIETENRCLSETTFRRIWHQCLPHIQFMSCKTDVCHKCESFRNRIQKAITEADKMEASTDFAEHISSAQKERDHYRQKCHAAIAGLQGHPKSTVPVPPTSMDLNDVHYTFDYAQSVLLPSHCRQEGALYFRSPYKANLFGICNDGRSLQTNYLFGEDQSIGLDGAQSHSANAVVSMLHHFFEYHGEGEKTVYLNADNCGGQNKNQVVTSYLAWRVANGYHDDIHLHFMKPYHARCLVDGMFGIARRKIRRNDVDSLSDLKMTIHASSTHNQADLYSEMSPNSWIWRDWKQFFKPVFRAVPGIGKYHHFHFASTTSGMVTVKKGVDGETTPVRLVKRGKIIPQGLPVRLEAKGFSAERAWYLYKNIRPFVKDPSKDLLCPLPTVPQPTSRPTHTEE